jgi:hypothetical protein
MMKNPPPSHLLKKDIVEGIISKHYEFCLNNYRTEDNVTKNITKCFKEMYFGQRNCNEITKKKTKLRGL